MTIDHYIVFVGAGASLSTELKIIEGRLPRVRIISSVMGKKHAGVNKVSSDASILALFKELANGKVSKETARLSVWFYKPSEAGQMDHIWNAFGHSAWVQSIPRSYMHKNGPTRQFIEEKIKTVAPLLHVVSGATYGQRKTSPLTLPLRNFGSKLTIELKQHWYNELEEDQLKKKVKAYKNRYAELRSREKSGFLDDKSLVFSPASDGALHGKAHPTGSTPKSFTCGRFRYGVALFPGFHFDVSASRTATIQCEIRTSSGDTRTVKSEKREYINIFPNDHLLPDK